MASELGGKLRRKRAPAQIVVAAFGPRNAPFEQHGVRFLGLEATEKGAGELDSAVARGEYSRSSRTACASSTFAKRIASANSRRRLA